MQAWTDGLLTAGAELFTLPFVVFGHSLGGLVAEALVQRLLSAGRPLRGPGRVGDLERAWSTHRAGATLRAGRR